MMILLTNLVNSRIFCRKQRLYRLPSCEYLYTLNLWLSSSVSIPTQLHHWKTGLPFVILLVNPLRLTNESTKSLIQNGNPLFLFGNDYIAFTTSEKWSIIWFGAQIRSSLSNCYSVNRVIVTSIRHRITILSTNEIAAILLPHRYRNCCLFV